jgi:Domain of unknown function (DUF4956)/3-keto-disaccharide hydrolase
MSKTTRLTTILLLAIFLISLSPSPAMAQDGGGKESFDTASPEGWEIHPQAKIADGVLYLPPESYAFRLGEWADINLTIQIRMSGEGETLIAYNMREEGRYNLVIGTSYMALEKEASGTISELGKANAGLSANTWATLAISVSDSQHQVSINDQIVLTAEDSAPLSAGGVFFQPLGRVTLEIDEVTLGGTQTEGMPAGEEPPGEEPLPEGEPAPEEPMPEEEPAADIPAETTVAESTQGPLDKRGLIEALFAQQATQVELTTFMINMLLSAVCAYILSIVYIHWGSSLSNRRKFAANFMLMTITTTFIILVVRSSVALSLGLVGALSIVRFRTAVKEPEELAYLFFAIGLGIGLGDNQRMITFVALVVGILIIGLRRAFRKSDADVNLHVTIASHDPIMVQLETITQTLRQHTAKLKLLRFDESATALEAAYLIEFRDMADMEQARTALRALSPALEITFMDNKGLW